MIIKTYGNLIYEIYRINGKKIIKTIDNFFPYFYIPIEEDIPKNYSIMKVENVECKSIFGDKLKKITVRNFKIINELKNSFSKTFEADLTLKARYLIDKINHNDYNYDYRILFIDMEMENTKGFPFPEKAEYSIATIACYDNILKKYIIFVWREDQVKKVIKSIEKDIYFFNDEREMIFEFANFLSDIYPEIITGWNVETFDFQYLINRMIKLNLNPNTLSPFNWVRVNKFKDKVNIIIEGIEIIDLMKVYMKFQFIKAFNPSKKLESYSLKAVSEYEEIGEKYKLQERISLSDMWKKDLNQTIEYCKRDVELLVELENKLNLIKFMDTIKRYAGCELKDTLANSRVLDFFILKYAKFKENIILPTAEKNMEETYEGPFIYVDKVGIIKNVAAFDFESFYPTIIETFNLSPEIKNINEKSIKVNNLRFSKERIGFCAKIVRELINERKKWKINQSKYEFNSKEYLIAFDKQISVKTIVNSFYGVLGYKNFRLYDRDIASTVTFVAREIAKKTKEICEKYGYKVVYVHTDSSYIKLPDQLELKECIKISKNLVKKINIELDKYIKNFDVNINTIKLDFEKFFKSAVFLDRKAKYFALLVYDNGKEIEPTIRITGFEGIKRDTPKIIRNILKEFYFKILNLEDFNSIRNFIKEKINEIKKINLTEIGFTIRISKNIEDYKNNSQHIRAAKYSNKYLNTYFKRTDYIKLIYVKKSFNKFPKTDIIAFDENSENLIKKNFEIDWERQLKRVLFMKIKEICDCIKIDYRDIEIGLNGQKCLKDF